MITIREAQVEDAIDLLTAEKAIAATPGYFVSRPDELTLASFQQKIEKLNRISNGKYLVAESDDRSVGHAFLEPMGLQAIRHVVRLTIGVHPGFEGQRIGELLMKQLIAWANSAPEVEKIELNVRAVNTRAIRLYEKLGFKNEGRLLRRVKFPDGTYCDDIEMGLFVKAHLK